MAGIAYKEEILSFGADEIILMNYSEDLPGLGCFDWAQTFYLESSLLVCKVYSSNIIIEQLFFCAPEDRTEVLLSIESSKKLRIVLPAPAVPNLGLCCDHETFSLFIATSQEKIFKFTFFQGWGFSNNHLKEMGGYMLDGISPRCFSLLGLGDQEFDVCIGLANGGICFISLPPASNSEYIVPTKITEIGAPTSILKALTQFVRKRGYQEQVLQIASMKTNQLVSLSSSGVLRLYNISTPSLISELDLGSGELEAYKFALLVEIDSRVVLVGYKERDQWWVCYVKVLPNSFEISGKFTEKGELVDICANFQGIWSVWSSEGRNKVLLNPVNGEGCRVYTWDDEVLAWDIEDSSFKEIFDEGQEQLLMRILRPGRFSKKQLRLAVNSTLGVDLEMASYEDTKILKDLSLEQLMEIFSNLKTMQIQDSEVLAISCCEEIGEFPVVLIRGNDTLGIIRQVRSGIESSSLYIKKTAAEHHFLHYSYFPERLSRFKLASVSLGLEKALLIIRLWRQPYTYLFQSPPDSFALLLQQLCTMPFPNHLLQLLQRALPTNIDTILRETIASFLLHFSTSTERRLKSSSAYWPGFLLCLVGRSITSSIDSLFQYALDLAILLTFCAGLLKNYTLQKIKDNSDEKLLQISQELYAMHSALQYPLQNFARNQMVLCQHFEGFTFPVNVCVVYAMIKSDVLFGDKHSFCLGDLSNWISDVVGLGVKGLLLLQETGGQYTSVIAKILAEHGEAQAVDLYFQKLERKTASAQFLKGKAYCGEGKEEIALIEFMQGGPMVESGNYESSYNNFLQGPWDTEFDQSTNLIAVYNSAVSKCIKGKSSKKVVLADFVISSILADFTDEKIVEAAQKLASVRCFHEALTLVQAHTNKRIIKQVVEIIIEAIVEASDFSVFLELPLNSLLKEIALKKLQSKCVDEHFDLLKTVSSTRYYDRAAALFVSLAPLEDRKILKNNKLSWSHALYSFAVNNQYFSSAAEAMYRYSNEIQELITRLYENKHEFQQDIDFLKELLQEHLMLAVLATRNINKVYEDCWFLVNTTVKKTKRGVNGSGGSEKPSTVRYLVTLQELEDTLAKYFQ